MNKDELYQKFFERIRQGRKFEAWEREQWNNKLNSAKETEVWTKWQGKGGRIDIRLQLEEDDEGRDTVIIVETKATNWDKIKDHRVGLTARKHVKQIWRYIEDVLEPRKEDHPDITEEALIKLKFRATPAVVYPASPTTPGRKEMIEEIFEEECIQVVWREEYKL